MCCAQCGLLREGACCQGQSISRNHNQRSLHVGICSCTLTSVVVEGSGKIDPLSLQSLVRRCCNATHPLQAARRQHITLTLGVSLVRAGTPAPGKQCSRFLGFHKKVFIKQ